MKTVNGQVNPNSYQYKSLKEFNGDTIQYLQYNFITHKDYYLGKPINTMIDKLEIPIIQYNFIVGNKLSAYQMTFRFCSDKDFFYNSKHGKKTLMLYICWDPPVSTKDLFNNKMIVYQRYWLSAQKEYLGKMTLTDAKLFLPN